MVAAAMILPPHAYLPGITPRHDETLFGDVKASVKAGMGPEELQRSEAWLAGLAYLDRGFYWEAHEVLEPIWRQLAVNSAERHLVQALIQLANASLKHRMGRRSASRRILQRVSAHLDGCGGADAVMGIALSGLRVCAADLAYGNDPDFQFVKYEK
jgi:hypothetical protein